VAKKDTKGKKPAEKVKKSTKKMHELYNVSGESIERKNRTCPKCGPGMFLGNHKDRLVCGNCKYVEMKGSDKPKEEAKPTGETGKKEESKPAEEKKAESEVVVESKPEG
jgi:ubiquitin-small subunit ribosomal protein S27Ae